jgi:hypothetical protein
MKCYREIAHYECAAECAGGICMKTDDSIKTIILRHFIEVKRSRRQFDEAYLEVG